MEIENDSNDTQIFQREIGVKKEYLRKCRFLCKIGNKNVWKQKMIPMTHKFFRVRLEKKKNISENADFCVKLE